MLNTKLVFDTHVLVEIMCLILK